MKLRRRYIRNIRQNLSFYTASTVLTMAALFLFFLFHIAGNAILDFADEFFEKQKLEDAHFTTYIRFRNRILRIWKKSMESLWKHSLI